MRAVSRVFAFMLLISLPALWAASCGEGPGEDAGAPAVMTGTGYLADIVRNVTGPRLEVAPLISGEVDPHAFQPTPGDAAKLAGCRLIVIDVVGLAPLVDQLIESTDRPGRVVIEAASGIEARDADEDEEPVGDEDDHAHGSDPHFWLDPVNVLAYVDNILEALILVDPEGEEAYRANAASYQAELRQLDEWIRAEVATIPIERRLLVTNHESFGYFADRYGFKVVGTVFRSTSPLGDPSARQLAELIEAIEAEGVPAIFVETGSSGGMAEQVARETGVTVVTDLVTHSLGGGVSTYVEMMKWNVGRIVEVLR